MAVEGLLKTYTFQAGADLSTRQYHAVFLSGLNLVDLCTTATQHFLGVLQNKPSINQDAQVALIGSITKWLGASNVVTAGDLVTVTSGVCSTFTTGTSASNLFIAGLVFEGNAVSSGLATVLLLGPSIS